MAENNCLFRGISSKHTTVQCKQLAILYSFQKLHLGWLLLGQKRTRRDCVLGCTNSVLRGDFIASCRTSPATEKSKAQNPGWIREVSREQGCQHSSGEILLVFFPSAVSLWLNGRQLAKWLESEKKKKYRSKSGAHLPLPKLGLLAFH